MYKIVAVITSLATLAVAGSAQSSIIGDIWTTLDAGDIVVVDGS